MEVLISIIVLIICFLLALIVLAQNPKGGGLADGFTGAQQIGGVQRTADFMEKSTWSLAIGLMVLCLVSAGIQGGGIELDPLDAPVEVTTGQVDPTQVSTEIPEQEVVPPPANGGGEPIE